MALAELIERWNSPEGHPYKGSLIDWAAYEADPTNIGCMCAGGQVLHLIAGWEPDRINGTVQGKADKEVAKALNISRAHAVLLRNVNDSVDGAPAIVLTDPGKVLGSEWSRLLDFWWHMDQMTNADWKSVAAARDAAWDAAWEAAWEAARAAAWEAAWEAARAAAWDAAWEAARDAARAAARDAARDAAGEAARDAASEIQGAGILRQRDKPFFFLSMFGFAEPEAIPARPADYGVVS